MNVAIDYSTVKWVKQELDATLKQARQALEAYVQSPADESQLRFCAVHLHQVHGTLQMVELYGAALLAEEMEHVIQALLDDAVGQKQEAYEIVMRAILQLPDYLDRLVAGGRDLPLVLLPLLNDLRALRGQKLLSENALFSPDINLPLPAEARLESRHPNAASVARKQRHAYQLALLGWYRGNEVATNLAHINEALNELQSLCKQDAAQRLWWIAGGMVSALRHAWLDTSMATKLLLGQVDRQIKRLMDDGEDALINDPPADLMKNLLFYVARANDGGEPVSLIKRTYKLSALLPDSEELERAQDSLSGHNAELMRTVAVAIKEDLTRVKDVLDLFLRGGRKAAADLQPASDTLTRVADTLGMLGQGALRKRVQQQAQAAADMVAGRRESDEAALMDIASALLYVESSVEALVHGDGVITPETEAPSAEAAEPSVALPESEFNQVRGVVADEAIRDIGQAKDAILAFAENSADFSVLDKVPALFNQVRGGLLLLNEQRAAALIDAVRGRVAGNMLVQRQAPTESALDDLADVISSVEYYLENLREGPVFGRTILDVAEKSLARLANELPDDASDVVANTASDSMEPDEFVLDSTAVPEWSAEQLDAFALAEPDSEQPDAYEVEGVEFDDGGAFGAAAVRLESSPENEESSALTGIADGALSIDLPMDIDPFVEGALDGSFATDVHEAANDISDESPAEWGLAVSSADADAPFDAAPELTLGVEEGDVSPSNAERSDATGRATPAVAPPAGAAEAELQAISDEIDEEILEIFIEEADEELVRLGDVLPRWVANAEDNEALTDMRRSFHTLKGSGRLVGALRIGEFAWGYESMLNRMIDGSIERSPVLCSLLERAAVALPELVEQIRSRAPTTQPVETLMQYAHAVSRGEAVDPSVLDVRSEPPVEVVGSADDYVGDVSNRDETIVMEASDVVSLDEEPSDAFAAYEEALPLGGDDEFAAYEEASAGAIDPVLYEIFCNESREHLRTLGRFLEECRSAGEECRASDDLMRALHTLHGSARMVRADAIAELAFEIEKYGKALRNDQRPMSQDGMRLLGQAAELIEAMLPNLRGRGMDGQAVAGLIAAVAALPRTTANVEHIPSAEVPLDQDDVEFEAPQVDEASNLALASEDVVAADVAIDAHTQAAYEEVGEAVDDAVADEIDHIEPMSVADSIALSGCALDEPIAPDYGVPDMHPLAAHEAPFGDDADAFMAMPAINVEEDLFAELSGSVAGGGPSAHQIAVADGYVAAAPDAVGDYVNVDYGDVDADLLEVFLEEGDEILAAIDTTLQAWVQAPEDQALSAELQRHLHTLKGGARMANLGPIGDLSHAVESLLIAVCDGQVAPTQTLFDTLMTVQDSVVHMLEAAHLRRPMQNATALVERLESLRMGVTMSGMPASAPAADLDEAESPAAKVVMAPEPLAATRVEAAEPAASVADEMQKVVGRNQQELVRVRADLLDNMVNFAGEISIYRSRLEQQIGSMRFNLGELGQTVMRLREQLRQIEIETEAQVLFRYERDGGSSDDHFDPLEMDRYSHLQQLSRSMLEGIGDLVSIQGLLDNITRESETLLLQQARVNTELQEGLMRTRMVPFSGLAPRMRRIVRQACQELGKRAELTLEGAEGEMDRTVIDRIIAPIEHMLRNALAHGIESPEQRRAAGKREAGSIKVSLSRDGSEVVITMSDDGAGMNIDAIRRKARERGLIGDDSEVSDIDVMQFVLETGFSTAEKVSQISGRGVGMDVVNSEVKQLGGSLHIDSAAGRGTTFTIRLPFTLAISQALLVQVHEEVYAIPLTGIEGIARMHQNELSRYLDDHALRFEYAGHSYPVHNLGGLLGQGGLAPGPAASKRLPVLLVRSGEHRMALQVDALLGSRETVIKSVGPQISTVRGISGATILGDGRVVLILDLGGLLRTGGATLHSVRAPAVEVPQARALTVMVVDDSITVRKVTTRLLERNDMQVITAKDGVDAVAKLQEHIPDVMLLDIEMPRMDGFELATHVRNEPRLRSIPMIMITSRTGDKHRRRAMEIGVDRYLGKPYQESELLDTIRGLTEERRVNG